MTNETVQVPVPARVPSLAIPGSQLEPLIARFRTELEQAGVRHPEPHFYLADEWGVLFDDESPRGADATPVPSSRSIGIPFYLVSPDLTARHEQEGYWVGGTSPDDILRYLRHEMGHVVAYAYRLYLEEDWVKQFGDFWQPYEEDYQSDPESRNFVRHLPGCDDYAQKHPDEDWAETFAVWLTGAGLRQRPEGWRSEYADWPVVLAKLRYCDRIVANLPQRDPPVTTCVPDSEAFTFLPEDYYADETESD